MYPIGLTYKMKNHSRSIDVHYQKAPAIVSISNLPLTAADMFVMDNSEQIAIELTYLPENISLTLCGCSVSE
jgi:hypothetical protein